MLPRKAKRVDVDKLANAGDITQLPTAPRCSVKVLARPCPIVDVVSLGKRKARPDNAVEMWKDGQDRCMHLDIQDDRPRSKPIKKRIFRMPWVAPQSTQAEVYERAKSVVETFLALRDRDCALLAYGTTGSGKTFTMQGPKRAYSEAAAGASPNTVDNTEGLLQRCLQHIFTRQTDNTTVSVCAVEIYKEKIQDLLVPRARWGDSACECEILSLQNVAGSSKCKTANIEMTRQTQLRHKDKTMLREVEVGSVHTAMHTLSDALQSRTCRETKRKMESRRSHLLIGISLFAPPLQAQLDGRAAQEASKTATLWVGDLCGAEAYAQGASTQQRAETRSINRSLLSLKSCLQTLRRNQGQGERGVPPVRGSALTRILADIMHGVGHLTLTVHFSMRDADIEATRRTLQFAEEVAQAGVRLDGDEAPATQIRSQDPAASVPDERRVAAERQALDRQNLPESPERLRQQDALLQGAAQLAEAAVEREGAAYEEGVRAGRRVSTYPAAPVAQPSAVEQGEQGSGDENTGLQVGKKVRVKRRGTKRGADEATNGGDHVPITRVLRSRN